MAEQTDKEWNDELSPKRFLDKWQQYVDQGKKSGCKEIEISNESMDRLISMTRKAIMELPVILEGLKRANNVLMRNDNELDELEVKVERYEKALKEIKEYNDLEVDWSDSAEHFHSIATEALEK